MKMGYFMSLKESMMVSPYNKFSIFLKNKYGEKVYKIPLKIKGTCPNRLIFGKSCAFCGDEGGSFENLDENIPLKDQLYQNIEYISNKYRAKKFIGYYQNYTNTFVDFTYFKNMIDVCIRKDIVAIYISTRPDAITDEQLEFLSNVKYNNNIDIVLELGLQSINYKTLKRINRGHSLAQYIYTVNKCRNFNIDICTHLIFGLPGDNKEDVVEAAKILSALKTQQVKIHSLYILENTDFGNLYKKGELKLISKDDYVDWVITFLEYLDPSLVVQRLIGRSPEDVSLFSNWDTSWWKIVDSIERVMNENGLKQGDKFNYLEPIKYKKGGKK